MNDIIRPSSKSTHLLSPKMLCRICLRSDIAVIDDSDGILVEFYSVVLCDRNMAAEDNQLLKFCWICKHQLKKFYNFRQKCQRANRALMRWKACTDLLFCQESLQNLHEMIEPTNLTVKKNAEPISMEFTCTEEPVVVKIEVDDSKTEEAKASEDNYIINNERNHLKIENNYCHSNDNDDDDDDIDYEPKRKKRNKTIDSFRTRKKSKESTRNKKAKQVTASKGTGTSMDTNQTMDKEITSKQIKLKERILKLLESGEFQDLGENVTINKEIFIKIFEKCDKSGLRSILLLKPGSSEEREKLRKFLVHLLKKNNPQYEDMFDVQLLDTYDKKLEEFHSRRLSKQYCQAQYKCEQCYKAFEVQSLLHYHRRWHQSAGEFECEICAMRFANRKALAQHRNTNHCAVYRCKLCPMLTYNAAVMVNHYNQHKGMEYSCPICLSVFSNKNTLNNHRRQAHRTQHECALCARTFVSDKGLYFHTRLKHKEEMETKSELCVSCDKCEARLPSPAVLAAHVRQVHDPPQNIHKCFNCKEIFTSLEELKKHKIEKDHQRPPKPLPKLNDETNSDINEKPTCSECERSFNSRKSYLRHVNVYHKTKRIHKCGFCQAKFTSPAELQAHRAAYSHHRKRTSRHRAGTPPTVPASATSTSSSSLKCNDPDKPFDKCKLCSEMVSLARTNTMYQHFQSCHPDTPYSAVYRQPHYRHLCHLCGKTFKDLSFFLDHANLHSGARPYQCGACSRAFSSRRHLRLHGARHAPPRHRCTHAHCGKTFHSAANLYAHTRGHIGDRRFKCEICSKGFLHQAALNEHVRGVHNHIRRARKCTDK